jgi:ferredoxin
VGAVHDGRTTTTRADEGPMKVNVNFDLGESNAICMGIAPEVFEVREDNFLYILDENPPEALRPQMEQAVASCPRAAITLED